MSFQHDQLTAALNQTLNDAKIEAERRHGNYLDVEHLLLSLLGHPGGTAQSLFLRYNVNTGALYGDVAANVGMERPTPEPVKGLSRAGKLALDRAIQEGAALHHPGLDTGHLLISLMGETEGTVHDVLAKLPFSADDARAFLREQPTPQPSRAGSTMRPHATANTLDGMPPEYVLIPTRAARKPKPGAGTPSRASNNLLWIVLGIAALIVYMAFVLPGKSLFTFVFVVAGWIFSLCLHEFAHALVAYWGGDYTVKDKGYLTFNPLKYMHPTLSIIMPLIFLALGGIGLPGGAVYIERHRLKNKWWGAAVSAAGPTANLLLAALLAMPFALGLVDTTIIEFKLSWGITRDTGVWQDSTIWSAVAFLAMLQVTSVFFNLLPIPPLDGFGVIEPFLDDRTRIMFRQVATMGMLLLLVIMWTPLGNPFWNMIFDACRSLSIPGWLVSEGYRNFMFWRGSPQ